MNAPDKIIPRFAEKHYPEALLLENLDKYLYLGWYRMGQSIFTTHFLCFDQKFYSALWIRLNLFTHTASKSQRKLFRKNNNRFQIKFEPFSLTKEKEQLYWRYKQSFKGFLAGTLEESLLDGEDANIYNTYEVQIYDNENLVGLSFFDLGKNSAASIMGIYDPDYQEFSLGYYSMLLEMDYCLKQEIEFYYPGYIVPGYDRFDYKIRIGEVEVYQMNDCEWEPLYDANGHFDIPVLQMEEKLKTIASYFDTQKINNHFYYYPLFEANLFGFWNTQYLDFPLFLQMFTDREDLQFFYFLVYDPRVSSYKILRCLNIENHSFFFNKSYLNTFDPSKFFMILSSVEAILIETSSVEDVCQFIGKKGHVFI